MKNINTLVHEIKVILDKNPKNGIPLYWNWKFLSECQKYGFQILPSNFYSPIPEKSMLDNFYIENDKKEIYDHPTIFDKKKIENFLLMLLPYKQEFTPPSGENDNLNSDDFKKNELFNHSDAAAYYSIIRDLKPKKIIEIGSGYSTIIALAASKKNRNKCKIVCYEPFPTETLKNLENVDLIIKQAQDIQPDELNEKLSDGDLLFIDSTHTVKNGSDVIHLITRVLPYITKKIIIHFHDIYIPFIMPRYFVDQMCFWSEQELLYAFLLNNKRAVVVYSSQYCNAHFSSLMNEFTFSGVFGGSSSIWFKYNESSFSIINKIKKYVT